MPSGRCRAASRVAFGGSGTVGAVTPLDEVQRTLADRRAHVTAAVGAASTDPAGSFTSIRDTRAAALKAGLEPPDLHAERAMLRAAGFGRWKPVG